jgi:hypothetical protein
LATKACELTGRKNSKYLETLAAAYAHAGDFQHAVEWEQRAIASEISPKQVMRERLQLYRAGKVWTQN